MSWPIALPSLAKVVCLDVVAYLSPLRTTLSVNRDSLRTAAVTGGVISVSAQVCKVGLQVLSTVVLARLLRPADFGVVAMAASAIGFLTLFRDFGIASAIVQARALSVEEVNGVFWVQVAAGAVLSLLTVSFSPLVAIAFGQPAVVPVVRILGCSILLGALTTVPNALLSRQLRFGRIATIEIAAASSGLALACLAAWRGWAYWALVVQTLSGLAIACIGYWIACAWRPGRPRWHMNAQRMLLRGAWLGAFGIVNYVDRNADNFLVGRSFGEVALGLYSRAYQFLLFPLQNINQPIAAVAVSSLRHLVDRPEHYRLAYISIVEKLTLVTMPLVAFMFAVADALFPALFGPAWSGAVPIFRWLAVYGFAQTMTNTTGWLFVSQGRNRELFRWGVLGMGISVASFVVGLPWGVVGLAAAYATGGVLLQLPLLLERVGRAGPVGGLDVCRATLPGVKSAALVGAGVWVFRAVIGAATPWASVFAGVLGAVVGMATSALWSSNRRVLRESFCLLGSVGQGLRGPRTQAAATLAREV